MRSDLKKRLSMMHFSMAMPVKEYRQLEAIAAMELRTPMDQARVLIREALRHRGYSVYGVPDTTPKVGEDGDAEVKP